MPEKEPSSPELQEQSRLTAVLAFSIGALAFNGWVSSESAREDAAIDFSALQRGKEHPLIEPMEFRRNLAAWRIMQTLDSSIDRLLPVVLLPEIIEAGDLYNETDAVVEQTGLNRLSAFDLNKLGPPVHCFLRDVIPETKVETVVQQARLNRGTVKTEVTTIEEMVATMKNTPKEETLKGFQILPNGMLAEIHSIPASSTKTVDMPFYQQYVSSSGGAEEYLEAFLEDVKWVSDQFA